MTGRDVAGGAQPLRPEDIVGYPLRQALRGYAIEQVDELLDRVADEIERLNTELTATRARLDEAQAAMSSAGETEATLKRMLVSAQQAAERSIEQANERARRIVEDAQREADAYRRDDDPADAEDRTLEQRRHDLRLEVQRLEERTVAIRSRLRDELGTLLRTLDDHSERP